MSDLCKHDLAEQDTYVADGYCPLCLLQRNVDLAQEIERLKAELEKLQVCFDAGQREIEFQTKKEKRLREALRTAREFLYEYNAPLKILERVEEALKGHQPKPKYGGCYGK